MPFFRSQVVDGGSATVALVNGTNFTQQFSFFNFTFSAAPVVTCSVTPFTGNTGLVVMINGIATFGFTYRVMFGNAPPVNFGANTSVTVDWIAFG
jgi:hypothetical protein